MMDWQPIETAPKDGTVVDLWMVDETGNGWRQTNAYYVENRAEYINFKPSYGDGWFAKIEDYREDDFCDSSKREWRGVWKFTSPTHWMPIPAPPVVDVKSTDAP